MTSFTLGTSTSPVEVNNVDSHGIWIIVREKEHFCHMRIFRGFANHASRKRYAWHARTATDSPCYLKRVAAPAAEPA